MSHLEQPTHKYVLKVYFYSVINVKYISFYKVTFRLEINLSFHHFNYSKELTKTIWLHDWHPLKVWTQIPWLILWWISYSLWQEITFNWNLCGSAFTQQFWAVITALATSRPGTNPLKHLHRNAIASSPNFSQKHRIYLSKLVHFYPEWKAAEPDRWLQKVDFMETLHSPWS